MWKKKRSAVIYSCESSIMLSLSLEDDVWLLCNIFCHKNPKFFLLGWGGVIVMEKKKKKEKSRASLQRGVGWGGFGCRQSPLAAPSINLTVMRWALRLRPQGQRTIWRSFWGLRPIFHSGPSSSISLLLSRWSVASLKKKKSIAPVLIWQKKNLNNQVTQSYSAEVHWVHLLICITAWLVYS